LDIDNENVDTMGGWLLDQKYDVKEGEEIEYHGYRFKAIQKEKNSIIVIDIFTTKKMKNQVESADSEETEETEVTE
jgi:CBS domain containing-hemolysin-like protein